MSDSCTPSTLIQSICVEELLVGLVPWLPQVAFTSCSPWNDMIGDDSVYKPHVCPFFVSLFFIPMGDKLDLCSVCVCGLSLGSVEGLEGLFSSFRCFNVHVKGFFSSLQVQCSPTFQTWILGWLTTLNHPSIVFVHDSTLPFNAIKKRKRNAIVPGLPLVTGCTVEPQHWDCCLRQKDACLTRCQRMIAFVFKFLWILFFTAWVEVNNLLFVIFYHINKICT